MQQSINLFEMAQYGGWIMIILAVLLAGACYIFIERLVVLKQATQEDKTFMAGNFCGNPRGLWALRFRVGQ